MSTQFKCQTNQPDAAYFWIKRHLKLVDSYQKKLTCHIDISHTKNICFFQNKGCNWASNKYNWHLHNVGFQAIPAVSCHHFLYWERLKVCREGWKKWKGEKKSNKIYATTRITIMNIRSWFILWYKRLEQKLPKTNFKRLWRKVLLLFEDFLNQKCSSFTICQVLVYGNRGVFLYTLFCLCIVLLSSQWSICNPKFVILQFCLLHQFKKKKVPPWVCYWDAQRTYFPHSLMCIYCL